MRKYKTLKTSDIDEVDSTLDAAHAKYPKTFKIENADPVPLNGDVYYVVTYSFDKEEEKKIKPHSALREP